MAFQTQRSFNLAVAAAAFLAAACSAANCSGAQLPLPARTVHQWSTETWIENLAVRPNGDLLLIVDENTLAPVHPVSLYRLANPASPQPELSRVYTFPLTTVLGITEIQPEVYAVLAQNFTITFSSIPGTTTIYTFDYSGGGAQPAVKEVATMPTNNTNGPAGIAALPHQPAIVLVADTFAGLVWAVNVTSGTSSVWAHSPEMAQVHNYTNMGINGLRASGDYLYFTNSDLKSVFRVPLSECGNGARPRAELVADLTAEAPVFIDDFTIGDDGTLWVTSNGPQNVVISVRPDGHGGFQKPVVAAGGLKSTAVQGAVAAAFGKGPSDRNVLYVTTNGGLWGAGLGFNQTATEPGKVVAVDITCFEQAASAVKQA